MSDLEKLLHQATQEISQAKDLKTLDDHRINYLGKKGKLTEQLKSLGQLPPEQRREVGQEINIVKEKITTLINTINEQLQQNQIDSQLAADSLDITLPGRRQAIGSIHP